MFISRCSFRPAPGKEQALRDLLARNLGAGTRSALAARLWGPAPELELSGLLDSLADYEQAAERWGERRFVAELAPLLAAPPASAIDQLIVEAAAGPPPNYVMRLAYEPAQGNAGELRGLLEQRMRAFNQGEGRVVLSMRFSGGAVAFFTETLFQSLAELEQTRSRAQQNPAARQVVTAMGTLLARPAAAQEIYRVLARSGEAV